LLKASPEVIDRAVADGKLQEVERDEDRKTN
jgi:hypothetical protein